MDHEAKQFLFGQVWVVVVDIMRQDVDERVACETSLIAALIKLNSEVYEFLMSSEAHGRERLDLTTKMFHFCKCNLTMQAKVR